MKTITNIFIYLSIMAASAVILSACSNSRSYAELLNDETKAINAYLADQRVIGFVPADSVFQQGNDAPYYRMDEDGTVYMRVIKDNPDGVKAKYNDLVYMRFTRYNLFGYSAGTLPNGEGNDETPLNQFNFRFQNFEVSSSSQWGEALQVPLKYLHYDCEVEIVVRSQAGRSDQIAAVIPYMYRVRYYKSNI